MKIRNKLTYLFVGIVSLILVLSSLAIFYFSADYRAEDFYNRLYNKGKNVAKLLIEVEEVDANLLQRIEADNPQNLNSEKLIIFNYRDEILYENRGNNDIIKVTKSLLDKVRLEGEVRYKEKDYEVLGFMFTDEFDRFVVIVAAKDVFGMRKIRNLRYVLILVFGVGLVIASILGWIYAGKALQPINRVISDVVGISRVEERVSEGNSHDEIARLAATFNEMLERLEKAFGMQRHFIANSSHELRTPLTAITGQLEVCLMNNRSPEEYRETMNSVLEDIKNLNNRTNQLLLLAQASSESSKTDFKPLRIDEVIFTSMAEVTKRDKDYKVIFLPDESLDDEDKLIVNGNGQLLKSAIINLIDNGCKYSENHEVKIVLSYSNHEVILTFKDAGIGIPVEDQKLIFEPFHRAGNALPYKGHGIGLSLVKRIVEIHDGQLSLVSAPDQGSIFTIRFSSKF